MRVTTTKGTQMATTRSKTAPKPAAETPAKPASKVAKSGAAAAESTTSMGRVLDARPDRLDFRDRLYAPPLRSLPAVLLTCWRPCNRRCRVCAAPMPSQCFAATNHSAW